MLERERKLGLASLTCGNYRARLSKGVTLSRGDPMTCRHWAHLPHHYHLRPDNSPTSNTDMLLLVLRQFVIVSE